MRRVSDQDDGQLRNTLYEQHTRSQRKLTRSRLFFYNLLVPVGLALVKLVWRWSRIVHIEGEEHIRAALARAPSFIPVYWHQHQLFCVKLLLAKRAEGVKLGFLIAVEVQAGRGAAGAIVAAPHDSHGIRRLEVLADPVGSLRHPQAFCARQYRGW
jgi:hypothetical protein